MLQTVNDQTGALTPLEFCRWMQGFLEIKALEDKRFPLNEDQVKLIQEHLQLVFHKVTGWVATNESLNQPVENYPHPAQSLWNKTFCAGREAKIC